MFKIKNGKLCTSTLSFSLPEDMLLQTSEDATWDGGISFTDEDEHIIIEIYEEERDDLIEDFQWFLEEAEFDLVGEIEEIDINGNKGIAAKYVGRADEDIHEEHYEIRIPFIDNDWKKQVTILVVWSWKIHNGKGIDEVLEMKNIKDFLASLE